MLTVTDVKDFAVDAVHDSLQRPRFSRQWSASLQTGHILQTRRDWEAETENPIDARRVCEKTAAGGTKRLQRHAGAIARRQISLEHGSH